MKGMKRIALAEDDGDDQDIFREVIAEINSEFEVLIAENGEKLLELVDQLPDAELPDLFVLDQNMPRLKGLETIHVLKSRDRYREIPAVIYSTYHDPMFIKNCKDLEIELFLKPDTFDELRNTMNKLINRYF